MAATLIDIILLGLYSSDQDSSSGNTAVGVTLEQRGTRGMYKKMSEEELKEIIRRLGKIADLSISEERIQILLPAFRAQLEWISTLNAFELPVEAEPSPIFRLKKRTAK